jgi:hypothetical protein
MPASTTLQGRGGGRRVRRVLVGAAGVPRVLEGAAAQRPPALGGAPACRQAARVGGGVQQRHGVALLGKVLRGTKACGGLGSRAPCGGGLAIAGGGGAALLPSLGARHLPPAAHLPIHHPPRPPWAPLRCLRPWAQPLWQPAACGRTGRWQPQLRGHHTYQQAGRLARRPLASSTHHRNCWGRAGPTLVELRVESMVERASRAQ